MLFWPRVKTPSFIYSGVVYTMSRNHCSKFGWPDCMPRSFLVIQNSKFLAWGWATGMVYIFFAGSKLGRLAQVIGKSSSWNFLAWACAKFVHGLHIFIMPRTNTILQLDDKIKTAKGTIFFFQRSWPSRLECEQTQGDWVNDIIPLESF